MASNGGFWILLFVSGIAALMRLMHFPNLRGNYPWLINKVFV
jgi:uncharacterized membrane protein SirB2